jgi:hypothetical protein
VLSDLFYHLGTAIGGLGSHLPGKAGAAIGMSRPEEDAHDPEAGGGADVDPDAPLGHAGELVAGAAAAWLVARVLRPRPVSWPRVVIAGIAATFLADLAGRTLYSDGAPAPGTVDDDPEALVRRYGAGVALAAGYAALFYPRLPGPPLLRGLAFGAMDMAAGPHGGLAGLAAEAPTLRFPLQAMVTPAEQDASPLAPMVFGLGLGLFYRHDDEDA